MAEAVSVLGTTLGSGRTPASDAAGEAAAEPLPELDFPAGLPGFPTSRRFALVEWPAAEADSPFRVLTDLDDPAVAFLVAPAASFFSDYVVDVDDDTADLVGLAGPHDPDDALLLVIVALGDTPAAATANLLGPLLINTRRRIGVQLVLANTGFTTAAPLAPTAPAPRTAP